MKQGLSSILLFCLLALLSVNCNRAEKYTKLGWQEIDDLRKGIKKDGSLGLNYFEQALALEPNNVTALHGMGVLLSTPETRKIGVGKLERAIEINPQYSEAYIDLAEIQRKSGLKDKSLETLTKGLSKNRISGKLFIARASFYARDERFSEAMADLEHAQKLNENDPNIYYNRGLINVHQKDLDAAYKNFTHCLEIEPENLDFMASLARTQLIKRKGYLDSIAEIKSNAKKGGLSEEEQTKISELKKLAKPLEQQARDLVEKSLNINPHHRPSMQLRYDVLDKELNKEMAAKYLGVQKPDDGDSDNTKTNKNK